MTPAPSARHFDLAVIGTGSGNMIVDSKFDDLSVAIIEEGLFGGTCLNVGCIPSKMLAYTADVADIVADASRFDVDTDGPRVRWAAVRERIFGQLDENEASGRKYREDADNTTVFAGTGTFTGPRTISVTTEDGEFTVTADRVVIAAGGRPVVPPPVTESGVPFHTSNTIMRIDAPPPHLLVLGGGYIAAELAHVFAAMGTRITIVEGEDHLLGPHDHDITDAYTAIADKRYDLHLGTKVTGSRMEGEDIVLELDSGDEVRGDMLLVAAGRRPNSDRIDCEAGGIDVDDSGRIVVDEYQRTSVDGVFALGDICSPVPLKHVANREARVVAHNLLNPDHLIGADHDLVPSAVFTEPQVASVGRTENQLREDGVDYVTATTEFADIAYGWAMQDETGFCKILAERSTGTILGAHIIGPQAATLVHILVVAMQFDIDARRLATEPYWAHPAMPEIIENTLRALDIDS